MRTASSTLAIVAGVALVRMGWGGRRSIVAAAGWAVVAAGFVILAASDGAWGIAIGCLAATTAALALVLAAGWRSPARGRRSRRDAPPVTSLPWWRGLGRRLGVFFLVVPGAAVAGFWLAFGVQTAGRRRLGMGDADATATLLLLFPLTWCLLTAWQMSRTRPRDMVASPAIAALAGTVLWGLG